MVDALEVSGTFLRVMLSNSLESLGKDSLSVSVAVESGAWSLISGQEVLVHLVNVFLGESNSSREQHIILEVKASNVGKSGLGEQK